MWKGKKCIRYIILESFKNVSMCTYRTCLLAHPSHHDFQLFHFWKDSRVFYQHIQPSNLFHKQLFFLGLKIIPSVFASSFNPSIILVKNLRRFPFLGYYTVMRQQAKQCCCILSLLRSNTTFYLIFCAPWKIRQTAQVINTHGTAWNQFCAFKTPRPLPSQKPFFVALPYSWDQGFSKALMMYVGNKTHQKNVEPCNFRRKKTRVPENTSYYW